jgi:hypothetical protein
MLSKKPWQPEFVLLFGTAMFACYGFGGWDGLFGASIILNSHGGGSALNGIPKYSNTALLRS